ncbi:unnamed protein product, partial [Brassica rapa subsp. trilocularis]
TLLTFLNPYIAPAPTQTSSFFFLLLLEFPLNLSPNLFIFFFIFPSSLLFFKNISVFLTNGFFFFFPIFTIVDPINSFFIDEFF